MFKKYTYLINRDFISLILRTVTDQHFAHTFQLNEPPCPSETTISDKDYESIVLMKLRQFEERKRLIREMQEEDE